MKRFLSVTLVMILLMGSCRALDPIQYFMAPEIVLGYDDFSKFNEEKMLFLNSLIKRVWSIDFGKLVQVFADCFFRKEKVKNLDFDKTIFMPQTIEVMEIVMYYLCTAPIGKCLEFCREFVNFFKVNLRSEKYKSVLLYKFREFICCLLIGLFRFERITNELILEKNRIMCDLYEYL